MSENVKEQHELLTQEYATWGDKLLQHTDVLYEMQVNRNIKPITIQLAPNEACFSGDTKVSLLNGTDRTLQDLAENEHEPFWIYSYDTTRNMIVPGLAARSRLTRVNTQTIIVTLDNGAEIKCTPDHGFLLRDGTYREARDMIVGQSLMPLYRRASTKDDDERTIGYEMFLEPSSEEWMFTHRRVTDECDITSMRFNEGKTMSCERTDAHTVRHHIDHNKFNNTPENIGWMMYGEHRAYHGHAQRELSKLGIHPFQIYTKTQKHRDRSSKFTSEQMVPIRRAKGNPFITPEIQKMGLEASNKVCRELGSRGEHNSQIRVAKNTHHFQSDEFKQAQSVIQRRLVDQGLHVMQKPENKESNRRTQNELLANGEHYFQSEAHRKSSSDRMKLIRKYTKHLFVNKLTKQQYTFAQWKIDNDINPTNHKVIAIREGDVQNVYCLEVDTYHNFALSAGVFVHNCDSDCDFCSVSGRPLKAYLPWSDVVQVLTDFKTLGAKSVELTGGGNPMLYRDKDAKKNINDIIELAYGLGYDIGIITNSEKLTRLKPEVHKMINWIRISLIKLDEGCDPEDYDFGGFPYEKLGFSYIIYGETMATPIKKTYRSGTSENTVERIAKLVDLHGGNIKFVRFAGNCLIKGNNSLIRKKFSDIVDVNDKYKKFFIKTIEDNDVPYDNGCYVGMIRPYVAASPDGTDHKVYACTSHVLNKRTYDLDWSLCDTKSIISTWAQMNENFKTKGYPYEIKKNSGCGWKESCAHCFYANNNKLLHTVAREMHDKNFP